MRLFNSRSSDVNEIVFEKKNKRYGAYRIRKAYHRTVIRAFLGSLLLMLLFVMPALLKELLLERAPSEEIVEVDIAELMEAPEFDLPMPPVEEKSVDAVAEPKIVKKEVPEKPKEVLEESIENPTKKSNDILAKAEPDTSLSKNEAGSQLSMGGKSTLKIDVDQLPSVPGGQDALYKFLKKNITYPPSAKKSGITGIVFVSFMIEANGTHDQVKILAGLGAGCDDEVQRVINLMPSWIPGKRRGENIAFMYNLPVQFALK